MTSVEKHFLSLSVSRTNIAIHIMQRQCSSMLGMSYLGGKLLPLVLTLVFWLLFPLFPLSSPLQHGLSLIAAAKAPQSERTGDAQGNSARNSSENSHGIHKIT